MTSCPHCSAQVPEGTRFCSGCGGSLQANDGATRTSLPGSGSAAAAPSTPVSLSQPGEARFLPGSVVAGRYRIVGLLGRGGMGEVYRADDMKLGQPVALKFLPQEVERDERRLQRFLNEVRLALRITHPNVCRVHDIGTSTSSVQASSGQASSGSSTAQHYISMEYVDGEDLSSLLRRIGRLPEERAIEIARQLCAGLAAAHEQGILHRDLKPANIMIDGRGRARITDFGLADLTGTIQGAEVRAGTPGYMAPEQLDGSGVTERSDIYALGLVLYEMFTGKPAFKARSAAEMAQLQQTTPPTEPTTLVKGLDPAIESVVLRALDTDPDRRPPSALAVAAALPGGDPLAAALAAGETPSPEMVAAAGEKGGLAPSWVALFVLLIVSGILAVGLARPRADALGYIDTPHSISALRERTRLMVERLGFEASPNSTGHGVTTMGDYVSWLREDEQAPEMRERVEAGRPPVYVLWYRQSPEPLRPVNVIINRKVSNDPPMTLPGMLRLRVDPQGRLVELEAVPAGEDGDATAAGVDLDALWASLFTEAGLDPERFTEVAPGHRPPSFADARAAWEGTIEEAPDMTLRVEAAAADGLPVWFRIVGPWTRDRGAPDDRATVNWIMSIVGMAIVLSVLTGLAVLARRNMHQGRSDVKGATRIGLYVFSVELLAMVLGIFSNLGISSSMDRIFPLLAIVTFLAAIVVLAYVALEPYVRRLWPTALISWTRLMGGRIQDPLVGRDLLIGGAFGVLTAFLSAAHVLLPSVLGLPEEPLGTSAAWKALGPIPALTDLSNMLGGSVGMPMMFLVSLVLVRLLLRNSWASIAVIFILGMALPIIGSSHPALDIALHAAIMALTLFVVLRIGLLAAVAMWFFDWGCERIVTLDPSAWTGATTLVWGLAMLLVTGYAAVVALGGRALLQDEV